MPWTFLRRGCHFSIPVILLGLAIVTWTDTARAEQQALYKLPWEVGNPHAASQGNFQQDAKGRCISGCLTHSRKSMWYSWDFDLPEGTKVMAARTGTVALFQSNWDVNRCGSPYPIRNQPEGYIVDPNIAAQANYVVIDHGDGTSALYLHLSKVADSVKEKARSKALVLQGDEIGLSGKTGWTHCFPHLHFQVQASGGWFTQSRAIQFSDEDVAQKEVDGVPKQGKTYAASGISSDDRNYYVAIQDGIQRLQSGVPWGTVWNDIKARFPNRPNEQVDANLGVEWKQPGAYERYISRQATTPVAAGRLFMEALISGNTNAALSLMSISSRSRWGATVANLSAPLSSCGNSAREYASSPMQVFVISGFSIRVTFTPPCASLGAYLRADPTTADLRFLNQFPLERLSRPLATCSLVVQSINEQWKVVEGAWNMSPLGCVDYP